MADPAKPTPGRAPAGPKPMGPTGANGKTPAVPGTPDPSLPAGGEGEGGPSSRLFRALTGILYFLLLATTGVIVTLFVFTLDFLDLVQFRYRVPPNLRQKWPLSAYYDFVSLHQMPDAERYRELMERRKQEFDELMIKGGSDLEKRAQELDASYQNLMRASEESYQKRQRELDAVQEELFRQKKALENLKEEVIASQAASTADADRVASIAASLAASMIKAQMEDNRLRPVQEIAAVMDPQSIGTILDEVPDNQLIYDILKGVDPVRAAEILAFMDPEKAGKILKIAKSAPNQPDLGAARSVLPPALQDLLPSAPGTVP